MSIDELGRAAAAEARRAAAEQTSATTMFAALHRRHRTRTAVRIGIVIALCAGLVAGVVLARSTKPSSAPPATNHSSPSSSFAADCQGGPPIQCLSGRRIRVSVPVRATIHAPVNFVHDANLCGSSGFESYRNDVSGTGVTVLENAVPVLDDPSWNRDASAGRSVRSIAHWLASRPFLTHTSIKRATIAGFAGMHVSGELKPGAKLRANKAPLGFVAPTFAGPGGGCTAGYGPNLFGTYTLVHVPGAGVTVIWSWTIEKNHALIAGNQGFINGLTFN